MLVVDDERAIREMLCRWLDRWGFEVISAADAHQALQSLRDFPVHVLVTGIRMPEHDGLWLIAQVRALWPCTQIIVVSGVLDEEQMTRAQSLGAVDYIAKPCGRDVLREALDRAESRLTPNRIGTPKARSPVVEP